MDRRQFLKAVPATLALPEVARAANAISPAAAQGATASPTDYSARLQALTAELGVTGASFAYWDGGALHTAVAGVRNSVTGDRVTRDTLMHVGSVTKVITTTLFLQLVDDGLVDLDDKIVKHVPELRLADPAALNVITCRMLLNHTSGIDCDMLPDYGPDSERIVDLIARCADFGQLHPPGGGPAYANIGVSIAGYIVQKLRGKSWYTLIEERIFEPLAMKHALVDVSRVPQFRASVGDVTNPDTGALVQSSHAFFAQSFAPAGTTAMMTAEDLVTFARAHIGNGVGPNGARILSTDSARLMTAPTAAVQATGAHWGLGWYLAPNRVFTHSGGGPGVRSVLYVHKASGRAIALLTNCDRGGALHSAMCGPIMKEWAGADAGPATPAPALGPVPNPDRYVGTYGSNLQYMKVTFENGALVARSGIYSPIVDFGDRVSPPVPLVPIGEDRFELRTTPDKSGAPVLFSDADAKGRVTRLFTDVRLLVRRA